MTKEMYLEFMRQLNRLDNQIDADYHKAANLFQLSNCELDVFYCFSMEDRPRTAGELCRECFVTKQTMSSALQGMEKKGWITFNPCEDKRRKLVSLTPAGIQKRRETADILVELEYNAMQSWDDQEIQTILRLLAKYQSSVKDQYQRLYDEKK